MTRLRVRVLPRAARLRRSADFQRVVRSGRRSSCQTVVVHLLEDAAHPEARIGFVVSKAVGKAVVRNRVRRRLQHAVGEERTGLGRALVVVRANPAAATASFALLATDLQQCLRKAQGGARRST